MAPKPEKLKFDSKTTTQTGTEFLISVNQKESNQVFVVARTVVSTDLEGRTAAHVWNPSATKVTLLEGQDIGEAKEYEEIQENWCTPPEADWEAKLPRLPQETPPDYRPLDEIDLKKSILTEDQRKQMVEVINQHKAAFVAPDGNLGCYNGPIRHQIEFIKDAKMPAPRNYRVPLKRRDEVRK
ncbi:hypothetical protein B9Z55_000914 [Caenorhabditis nigoni]|uniref:Uncharacterized protein n=1 Tax=Caenorhabditis nigoni TaxID=1611254 RepID=A0A2G5VVV7_9PELO|nr:hypothetical protein B9Z55_000914 [Caenorhabditis nigoni]